jgi:hypothetical protein
MRLRVVRLHYPFEESSCSPGESWLNHVENPFSVPGKQSRGKTV